MADEGCSKLQSVAALRNYCKLLQIKEVLHFLPCPRLICVPTYPEQAVMDVHPHLVLEQTSTGTRPLLYCSPTSGTFQNLYSFKVTTDKYQHISFICFDS